MASGDIVRIGGIQKYECEPVIGYLKMTASGVQHATLTEVISIQGSGFIHFCELSYSSGGSSSSATTRLDVIVDGVTIYREGGTTSSGGSLVASLVQIQSTPANLQDHYTTLPYISPTLTGTLGKKTGVFYELLKFKTSCVVKIISTNGGASPTYFRFAGGVFV